MPIFLAIPKLYKHVHDSFCPSIPITRQLSLPYYWCKCQIYADFIVQSIDWHCILNHASLEYLVLISSHYHYFPQSENIIFSQRAVYTVCHKLSRESDEPIHTVHSREDCLFTVITLTLMWCLFASTFLQSPHIVRLKNPVAWWFKHRSHATL